MRRLRPLTQIATAFLATVASCLLAASGSFPAFALPPLVATRGNEPRVAPTHVLVVMNANSPDSRAIAERYAAQRGVPEANVVRISCPETDEWTLAAYRDDLETFVRQRAQADPAIDYVVLTRGIPFRLSDSGSDGGYSTDTLLATCLLAPRPEGKIANPYFLARERFSRARFGVLLVTRLDGPTRAGVEAMLDSSLQAQPFRGPFYLRDSFIESMERVNESLTSRGLTTEWVKGANNAAYPHYEGSGGPYMAHWGAGPHDTQFTPESYERLRFLPGAIADLTWSVSAAGLHDARSLGSIAVMTANGAAGAQGYVSEPFSDALSLPQVVLDRYTHGFNLAESFSMGTPYLNWKQVVLGDPLCAPYADASATVSAETTPAKK